MKYLIALAALCSPVTAFAAEISTHVLDLAKGIGGANIPVTLARRGPNARWQQVAAAQTDAQGRIRAFGSALKFEPGDYQLVFDMRQYAGGTRDPFFPEIVVSFRVSDPAAHYHVPVVVSPYGYSTYRGN